MSHLIIFHRANLGDIFIVKIFHKNANDLESQFNVWIVGQLLYFSDHKMHLGFRGGK